MNNNVKISEEERKNKNKILKMYILTSITFILYFIIVLYSSVNLREGPVLFSIIIVSTVIAIIIAFYALKLEIEVGYYECKKCKHRYAPKSYFKVMISPHINTIRYMKCPNCNNRSWSKKVMTKQ